ncbi:MAG: hypothetical protein AB1529_01725 [Candidatus Micrarchaeota archaeon]
MTQYQLRAAEGTGLHMTRAASRFGRFRKEAEKAVQNVEVKEDQALARLMGAFEKFDCAYPDQTLEVLEEPYAQACELLKGIAYTPQDVKKFCIALSAYDDRPEFPKKAGLFLSALVNCGPDIAYIIPTKHLSAPMHDFGYKNVKNVIIEGGIGECLGYGMAGGSIVVEGDAGDHPAHRMAGGLIIVEGNAGFGAGHLEGGELVVKGNAGHALGSMMEGGTIRLMGKPGKNIGGYMKAGEIHLDGELGEVSDCIGDGRIYHKGALIAGK